MRSHKLRGYRLEGEPALEDGLDAANSSDEPVDAQSEAVLEALEEEDPALAGLFREGLRLLRIASSDGCVYLLAHIGRELSLAVLPVGLPVELAPATTEQNDRHREKIALFLGLPTGHPTVKNWFRLHGEFVGAAHYRKKTPSLSHIRTCFEQLTALLFGLRAPYFDTHDELQALIEEQQPTASHLASLERLLVRPQQRRHFFSHLQEPGWLEPLRTRGHFRSLPEVGDGDETWRDRQWPQGRFLVNVAPSAPREVVSILASLPGRLENPMVWLCALEAAEAMPIEIAADLTPKICEALKGSSSRYFAFRATGFALRLAEAGYASAFDLAACLLWLDADPNVKQAGPAGWPLLRLNEHEGREFFVDTMPALARIDRLRAAALQIHLLARITAENSERSGDWCESLEQWPSEHSLGAYVAASLARSVTDPSLESVDVRAIWELLSDHQAEIFERLRIRMLAAHGTALQDELDNIVGSGKLVDLPFGAREVALLLRSQFSNASPVSRLLFAHTIQRGPSVERLQHSLKHWPRSDSGASRDTDLQDRIIAWQKPRIRWFHDRIPLELIELAKELQVEARVPDQEQQDLDEVGHTSSSAYWVGEESPYSADDLASRSPSSIVALLSDWSDRNDDPTGTRGLEEALRQVVADGRANAPELCVALFEGNADRRFVLASLRGLHARCENDDDVDWQPAVETASSCMARSTSEREQAPTESAADDHIQLIREGMQLLLLFVRRNGPSDFSAVVRRSLEEAIRGSLPLETRNPSLGENRIESLISSALNSLVGDAARLAVQIGLWEFRQKSPGSLQEREDWLAGRVESLLKRSGISREIVLSVVGQYAPQLLLIAPSWSRSRLPKLFREGAEQLTDCPCWGTYAVRSSYSTDCFQEYRALYSESAAQLPGGKSQRYNWSPSIGIRRHVLIAVLQGDAAVGDSDGLVESTFDTSPEVGQRIYWGLFSSWKEAGDTVPLEFVPRLISFWEWRLQVLESAHVASNEPHELLWFVILPQLNPRDALLLGTRTARLVDTGGSTRHVLWDRLPALTEAEPALAAEMIHLLIGWELRSDHIYLPQPSVNSCLRALLESNSEEVRDRTIRLVHRLGEAGEVGFRELIRSQGAE